MKNILLMRKTPLKLFWSFSLLLSLLPALGWGQVNYVSWNFTTSITNANYASSTTNQNAARSSALTSPTLSAISMNGGISGGSANTFHRSTGWPTSQDNAKYLEFSVSLGTGQTYPNGTFNLAIAAGVNSVTTAPRNYQVQYGWGASPTFTAVSGTNAASGTATTGGTVTSLTTGQTNNTAVIPAPGNTTTKILTIRFVAYGSTSSSGNIQFGTIALTGVTPFVLSAPTVSTTTTATATITNNSAVLAGNVTVTGGSDINANGSVYALTSINNNPTIGGTGVTNLQTSSPAVGTGTFSNGTGSTLSPNTQYTHKAYAANTTGTAYGSAVSFYTHANTPEAPTVGGAAPFSLQVTIGSGDLNPSTTQYAIEIGSGNYVQANGTSTGTAVWQTASAWGTKTVTGLSESTLYSFQVYARNASNVVTSAGLPATGTTTANTSPTLTVGVISAPFGAICTGTSTTQTFNFHGTNLVANVTIGPLTGFTFSTTSDGTYENSLSLTPNGSNEILETIYVKFSPTLVQSYNTPIPVTGGGATATSVSISASGINTPVGVVTTVSGSSAITATGATLAASYTPGCTAVTATGIEYSINSNMSSSSQVTGTFPLTLSGLNANTLYYYRAFATDGTGTVNGNILSFSTTQLLAPVAAPGSLIGLNQFTANWAPVAGATSYRLDVSTSPTFGINTLATNLFISEYGEGSVGTKKYIEIYNGTGAAVNLANYQIWGISNGGSWPESTLNLTGTLANDTAYVISNNAETIPNSDLSVGNAALNFNGDDAIGIGWNGGSGTTFTLLDAVGESGADPGTAWSVAGVNNATADKILIRKPSVFSPNADWNSSAGTTTANSEWIVSSFTYSATSQNTDTGLHTVNGPVPSFVAPYNDFTVNATSQLVQNLSPATDYYYRVRAVSANSTSASSTPVIKVTTTAAPPTFGGVTQASGTSCSGTDVTFTLSGLVALSKSTISYSINNVAQTPIQNVTALGDGTATIQINLTTANNGQSLVITAIERTDFEAEVFNPTSGNSLVINNISALIIYYADADGDGYGVPSPEIPSCTGVPTYLGHPAVTNTTDCAPNNPLAWRLGDFYVDADNDTFFDGNPVTTQQCYGNTTPSGYVSLSDNKGTDCDDTKGEVNSNHVEVLGNGIDDNCDEVIDEVAPTTSLVATHCGSTLLNITNTLFANQVPSAQGYRFEISINGTNPRYYDSPTYYFNLLNIPGGVLYNTTYTVRVAVKTNDFWRAYSTTCLVTTPAVPATTNVGPAQCGTTVASMSTTIFAVQVTSANQYRFAVSDGVTERTYDSAVNRFSFAALGGLSYNTTYAVRVALRFGTTWEDYGTSCNITTPATPPTSNVIPSLCGTTISNGWTTIYAMQVPEATGYRFNVTAPGVTRFYDTPNNRFSLRNIASFTVTPNTTYTITVQILYNGFYQTAGSACTITTAGVVTRQAETAVSIFDVKAYPNPYADTFKLDMNTSGEDTVEVKVYDMIGRQMEATTLNVSDLDNKEIGNQYPSGVYNIIVTQGENVKTLRVIKR